MTDDSICKNDAVSLQRSRRVMTVSMGTDGVPQLTSKDFSRFSDFVASGHLNLMLGSGFSWSTGIPTLGKREDWFCAVEHSGIESDIRRFMNLLLKAEYYSSVLEPASRAPHNDDQLAFAKAIHSILRTRGNTSIPKRANVFTTNYDFVLEQAFEAAGLPCNDGFEGRIHPVYSTGSFSRITMSQSLEHEYLAQVPSVNLLKMHGSLSWRRDPEGSIVYADDGFLQIELSGSLGLLVDAGLIDKVADLVSKPSDGDALNALVEITEGLGLDERRALLDFSSCYDELCIVNPTKRKFSETVLELAYYELMRIYSNELDRSNALLIVHGFSFADEHILAITKRALRNPKLILVICCHTPERLAGFETMFAGFDNVWYLVGSTESGKPVEIDTDVFASLLGRVGLDG